MKLITTNFADFRTSYRLIGEKQTSESRLKRALQSQLLGLLRERLGERHVDLGGGGWASFDWYLRDGNGRFVLVEAKRKLTHASVMTNCPIVKKLSTVSKWRVPNDEALARLAKMAGARSANKAAARAAKLTPRAWKARWTAQVCESTERELGAAWQSLPDGLPPAVVVAVEEVDSAGFSALGNAATEALKTNSIASLKLWVRRAEAPSEVFVVGCWNKSTLAHARPG